ARARQRLLEDTGTADARRRVVPLLLHGDAAFAGQGAVAETLNLSQLRGYHTGGTIHLVINNQIGFTTTAEDARTSLHATDVARMIDAPILHVNGEDPMALLWVAGFALEFRQRFGRDVVIDLLCYRRQGHNEADQAAFTQPLEARSIASRPSFGEAYRQHLVGSGMLDAEEAEMIETTVWDKLEAGYARMKSLSEGGRASVLVGSTGVVQQDYSHAPVASGVKRELLRQVGAALTRLPDGFTPHPALAGRWLPARARAVAEGGPIDWPLAEALAFGTLLLEGVPVRLSGQDSRRGTFSQRHAVLYDFHTRERHIPLSHVGAGQARFSVHNSPLSQCAVLGFEYGYSQAHPEALVLWESQFGDFANNAQTVIDQFIVSGEAKWQTPCDLVLLLPHGYEGMGPEHSSARLERFLQLCAADNLVVANCSTPAQYFHLLRRQKLRLVRKPLVALTPKGLMFRRELASMEADFLGGSCFQELLPDPEPLAPEAVKRVVLCSGGVFYDLRGYRREHGIRDTALLRVEQLYPFHAAMLGALLFGYPRAREFVWCQEEPANMGAWHHLAPALEAVLGERPRYAGRPAAASPAAGSRAAHAREREALLAAAFGHAPDHTPHPVL
nr:2-oxoglutarate dehydrogenase E1 component [Akkermansiaceae bacterium]